MIFSEGFDKTLYIILESDKEYNETIVNFINKFPNELIQKIRMQIEKSKNNNLTDTSFKYYDEVKLNDNEVYSFTYSYKELGVELILNYEKINKNPNKSYKDGVIELKLLYFNHFDFQESLHHFIGSFECTFSHKKSNKNDTDIEFFGAEYHLNKYDNKYIVYCDYADEERKNLNETIILNGKMSTDIMLNDKGISRKKIKVK